MEPIILIRAIEESAVPDALYPVFSVWVQEKKHFDNQNDVTLSVEEQRKQTGTSWQIWGTLDGENEAFMTKLSRPDAQAIYNDIVAAVKRGDRVFEINRKEFKEHVEPVEGNRDNAED